MNSNNKLGLCSILFLIVVLVWIWQAFVHIFFQTGPAGFIGFVLLIVGIGFLISWRNGEKVTNAKATRLRMADQCDALVSSMGSVSAPGLALKSGELVIGRLSQAGLLEYVSDGSTYQGINTGLGVGLTKNVSLNVGGSQGQLTKNPEVEQIIDTGSVIFTDQRVLFAGAKYTREWSFAKMVNVSLSPNGSSVHMNVAGQSKVSGLQYTNANELTPGIMMSIAQAASTGGRIAAERLAKTYAMQFREMKA